MEDVAVAELALDVWPNILVFIEKMETGKKSKEPKCASYLSVQRACKDPLITAKLHFFVRVAKVLKPFLEKFQTTNPMGPFIEQELGKFLKTLMDNFVKPTKLLDNSHSVAELCSIDLENENNLVGCKNISIGLATKEAILKLDLSDPKLCEFKSQCLSCYKAIVSKLKERFSTASLELLTNLSSLSPQYISNHPNRSAIRFEELLISLIQRKIIKPENGDLIQTQYKHVSRLVRSRRKHESLHFAPTKTPLDTFFHDLIDGDAECRGE